MISKDSLKIEWIEEVAKVNKNADKILVEKVVRALYLLELLQRTGLKFVFKGGTALLLMMQEAKRLSIDIDIIIPEKVEIDKFLIQVIVQSDFLSFEENERKAHGDIEKAHYKFYYNPVTNTRAEKEYILLDVLYEKPSYGKHVVKCPVKSPFIIGDDDHAIVTIPSFEAILGDKLTAFAPLTTGVPYGKGKEIEIIKQLYDVGSLFDHVKTVNPILEVFNQTAKSELGYRKLDLTPQDVLNDIWETSQLIATRGKDGKGDFVELQKGIRNIRNFIFSKKFHLEGAMVPAAKAAYLSALLSNGKAGIKRFKEAAQIADWEIKQPHNSRLNKLKKTNPEAFFYWYQASQLKVIKE